MARCVGSEEEWRARVKDVIRSCIAGAIVAAGVKKWVIAGCSEGELKVDVPGVADEGGRYHAWWAVPKIVTAAAAKREGKYGNNGGGKKANGRG